jgi:molybdopterin/thiamine biosynthesis adenylyltransferase
MSVNRLAQSARKMAKEMAGVQVLSMEDLSSLTSRYALARRDAEVAVLELGIVPRRYLRNYGTIGVDGQLRLLRSCVAVIGLGGLGGYIVEGLARVGVGRLVLVDGDVFQDHNLNRQLLSQEENLGRSKAIVAAERVYEINRAVEVESVARYADASGLGQMLFGTDVVVDALDRLPMRIVLQEAAAKAGVAMVHGAIAGEMGQVMTILPGDKGLRALYGDGALPEHGAELELGTPPASPMMVAGWQVHEVVKLLTGRGDLLRMRMLFMDAMSGEVRTLDLDSENSI